MALWIQILISINASLVVWMLSDLIRSVTNYYNARATQLRMFAVNGDLDQYRKLKMEDKL